MIENKPLGSLYVVATPIGNLGDLSFRAVKILQSVQWVAAEDTRVSRYLLEHYSVKTPLISLHAYNEYERCEFLYERLLSNESIALVSDAGTPLISDPGYILVKYLRGKGIKIIPIPGACAAIAALSVSGLPTDRFVFEGFLPSKPGARQKRLHCFATEERTVIFYEAPHRVQACVSDMIAIFGGGREVTLARELTKQFETIITVTLAQLAQILERDTDQLRGEMVLLLAGCQRTDTIDAATHHVLDVLLQELPIASAVKLTAKITGKSKNQLYPLAILKNQSV